MVEAEQPAVDPAENTTWSVVSRNPFRNHHTSVPAALGGPPCSPPASLPPSADEGPGCIGSSPAFNAITFQSTSLSGINLSRLIPFRARAKDLKTVSQLVKQKVENRQEFWFEANMITNNNQHKSSEKEKGSMKDRYFHSRSESVESVAKIPGKPLLLPPPQQPQV